MEPFAMPPEKPMTLREYYAGLAMQGNVTRVGFSAFPQDACRNAVAYADALIAELSKK